MAPLLDLLMTLLHLGADGWRAALRAREEVYPYLRQRMCEVAAEQGARAAGSCAALRRGR
jgi:O-phospho-L-seryl-tRNASec:L-selenocysteinyl-tRNA synthase